MERDKRDRDGKESKGEMEVDERGGARMRQEKDKTEDVDHGN